MPLVNGIHQYVESETAAPVSTLLNRLGDSVRNLLTAEDTAWTTPAALSGAWVNFGSTFQVVRYRLRRGRVEVQGHVKSGTGAVLTLPVGMRPGATLTFATPANAGIADVRVGADGVLTVASYYAGGTNALVALNLSFVPGA